ncbi:hypothetical protein T459_30111 [Capsicum annuum]|uniref:RED-like N-terminal domain-containing protein n=1 Tax=Capsicum annuum TaxID=4072 RepID=A0A2G2Y7E2_CAPAN|nr:hypothetical protein T459_30111 [Capsicum annuum]
MFVVNRMSQNWRDASLRKIGKDGIRCELREEKAEEAELPKYRDRAKERREDQNPDYELTELDVFHAVPPPGNVDILSADAQKLSIAKSKYLGDHMSHHEESYPQQAPGDDSRYDPYPNTSGFPNDSQKVDDVGYAGVMVILMV